MRNVLMIGAWTCSFAIAIAAGPNEGGVPIWGIGPFLRDDGADRLGPLAESTFLCPITRAKVNWECKDLLCAGAVVKDGKVYMLYRAEDKSRGESWGTSRIGLAVSDDGRHFKRHPEPVLYPNEDAWEKYEWPGGCQDPRVMTAEDGTFVMTYTAWDGKLARLFVATSRDLYHWEKKGSAFARYKNGRYLNMWSKSGAIVCRREGDQFLAEKVQGKYWMYFGDTGAMLATSDNLTDWDVVEDAQGKPFMALPNRPGKFDSVVTEPGPPAFLTERGIFLLYNGGAERPDLGLKGTVWAVGEALFDRHDPGKVIARTDNDIFHPERDYEIKHAGSAEGGDNNVTFVESLVWFNHEWRFYCGCANSVVTSAFCRQDQGK